VNFFRILTFISIIFIPLQGIAFEADLEKDLQGELYRSRAVLKEAEAKLMAGEPVEAEIKALKAGLQYIKAFHLLLQERFRGRQEAAEALGVKAVQRQREMSEAYSRAIEEYINLIESLPAEDNPQPATLNPQPVLNRLKTLLDRILIKKKRPITGSLPYRNLNYPATEPPTGPGITPAYLGGSREALPEDLSGSPEAPISEDIASLAQSLKWNPVLIYEHVKKTP